MAALSPDKPAVKPRPSATIPDYSRERCARFWDPNKQLIASIRRYQRYRHKGGLVGSIAKAIAVFQHRFWSVVASADIPLNCQFGGGLRLPHTVGIVIHPSAKIGPNAAIFQQVTIVGDVEIGGQVEIGAGAKIVRPVKIGNHVRIGANAVVLNDIPDGATVVGIPAKEVGERYLPPSE